MNLLSASIVQSRHGADYVSIETDLPDPQWPYTGHLCLSFRVAKGQALVYMQIYFPTVTKIEIVEEAQ